MAHSGIEHLKTWFATMSWTPMDFQLETWQAYAQGFSGIVNAPTGSGKTFSVLLGAMAEHIQNHSNAHLHKPDRLIIIWVTPIKALAKEILISCEKAIDAFDLPWKAEIRTGDTITKDKKDQLKHPPEILIITPESLHVILSTKGYTTFLQSVECIVADEWHELVGSKRGVQTELAISAIKHLNYDLRIWGISATIGNM